MKRRTNDIEYPVNQYWQNTFLVQSFSEEVWTSAMSCTKETKLWALHWKILHNIYPTKVLLKKMKLSDSELCETCQSIETPEHFFYHCKLIKDIWKAVEKDLMRTLDIKDVLFGYQGNDSEKIKVNRYVLVAKMCVSKFRYGNHANLLMLYEKEKCLRHLE